jgi:hypothetical protein
MFVVQSRKHYMNDENFITPYGALATYRRLLPHLLRQADGDVIHAATADGKFHSVKSFGYEDIPFCYSVFKSSAHHHCMVYMLLAHRNDFEAIAIDNGKVYLYTVHFFQRYRQRMHLEMKTPVQVLMHYLQHNPLTVFGREMKKAKGRKFFRAVVHTGVVYGLFDNAHRMYVFDTLIDYYSLTGLKKLRFRKLRGLLAKLEES